MIEMCTTTSKVVIENIRGFFRTPAGTFIHAAATGMIGIGILLLFFSMMLSPSGLLIFLPAIVAFNGATGGYALSEREGLFSHRKLIMTALVAILTATGCVLITLFCPWEPLLDADRWFSCGLLTVLATFSGGWIARKNRVLQKKP